jgi:hypothetical protein
MGPHAVLADGPKSAPIVLKKHSLRIVQEFRGSAVIALIAPERFLRSPRVRSAESGDQAPTSPVLFVASVQTQSVIEQAYKTSVDLRGRGQRERVTDQRSGRRLPREDPWGVPRFLRRL